MPMSLQLSAAERELLLELLTGRIGELRQEVHHSKVSTFRDQLKETEAMMKGLVAKLESAGSDQESAT